jgi:hypothetical protein
MEIRDSKLTIFKILKVFLKVLAVQKISKRFNIIQRIIKKQIKNLERIELKRSWQVKLQKQVDLFTVILSNA